jgi:hypothetical protein
MPYDVWINPQMLTKMNQVLKTQKFPMWSPEHTQREGVTG